MLCCLHHVECIFCFLFSVSFFCNVYVACLAYLFSKKVCKFEIQIAFKHFEIILRTLNCIVIFHNVDFN